MNITALIVAAGRSDRFGGAVPKQFARVCERPLLAWTVSRFEEATSIDSIVLVVAEDQLLHTSQWVVDLYGLKGITKIVKGGDTRQESVRLGLEALPFSTDLVAIHDGARPLISPHDIDRVVEIAARDRAAMLAVAVSDTVKRVRDEFVIGTLDRDSLYLAQTPQAFQYDLILSAHQEYRDDRTTTDDVGLVEKKGFKVKVVEPTGPNPKVTTREDMRVVEAILRSEIDG